MSVNRMLFKLAGPMFLVLVFAAPLFATSQWFYGVVDLRDRELTNNKFLINIRTMF